MEEKCVLVVKFCTSTTFVGSKSLGKILNIGFVLIFQYLRIFSKNGGRDSPSNICHINILKNIQNKHNPCQIRISCSSLHANVAKSFG